MKFVFLLLIVVSNVVFASDDNFGPVDVAASILRKNGVEKATNIHVSSTMADDRYLIDFNLNGQSYRCELASPNIEKVQNRVFRVTTEVTIQLGDCINKTSGAAFVFRDRYGIHSTAYLDLHCASDNFRFDMNNRSYRCDEEMAD